MYKKKVASLLLAGLLTFIPVVLVGTETLYATEADVSTEMTKVAAKGKNYEAVKKKYNISMVYEITGKRDVTEEFAGYLKECMDLTERVMIYFPAGNFEINNDIYYLLHSKVYIVAEKNTVIKMTGSQDSRSLLRTSDTEKVTDVLVYGGTWNGNKKGKHVFDINRASGIVIKNVTIKNAKVHGVMLRNGSECTMENVVIENSTLNGVNVSQGSTVVINGGKSNSNGTRGISVLDGSVANVTNMTISKNGEYGISVLNSKLNLDIKNKQNNKITKNKWSGISATGKNTVVNVNGNTITGNGTDPKGTGEGLVGHGVGVAESATGTIKNNTISDNSQCGISVFDGGNATFEDNIVSNNGRHGIGARQNITIKLTGKNVFENNKYNGILVSDASNAVISGATIKGSAKMGISIVSNCKVDISNCTITDSRESNISITKGEGGKDGSKVTLKDKNTISGAKTKHGIVVSDKNVLEITGKGNQIKGNALNGISIGENVTLKITKAVKIEKNKQNGIYINGAKATLNNVTTKNNGKYGIAAEGGAAVTISKAIVENNKSYGVSIREQGTNVTLKNSTVKKNTSTGIIVNEKAVVKELTGNKVTNNGETGICVKAGATVKKVQKNTITDHTKYGMSFYDSTVSNVKNNKLSNPKGKNEIYVMNSKTNVAIMNVVTIGNVNTSSKEVTGTAVAGGKITITGGDKKYTGTVDARGVYSVKIAKQKKNKILKVTVADKNGNETYNSIKVK